MKRNVLFIVIIFVFFAIVTTFSTTVGFYVDWLFFGEVGYGEVFKTIVLTKVWLGLLFGVTTLVFLLVNVLIANRSNFPQGPVFKIEGNVYELKKIDPNLINLIKQLGIFISLFAAIMAAIAGAGYWEEVLLFTGSTPAGIVDPVFGRDVSFYLFRLPLAGIINGAIGILIIIGIIITALNYTLRGGANYIGGLLAVDRKVKIHLASLLSLWLINFALKFYLDRYDLLFGNHNILSGASYTDIHAKLPMLTLLVVLSLIIAAASFISILRGSKYTVLPPLVLFGIVYFLGFGLYPSLLQSFRVSPNEIVMEEPYIKDHIQFTRLGYDLDSIKTEPYSVGESLSIDAIENNISTIRNIRLWDEGPLLKTYSQLQQIRTYYKFIDVDNDRYMIDGKYTQVMLSPREISYDDLPGKSWINERLVFTHGTGLSMGPVSGITGEGLPEFYVKDIPPVSTTEVTVTRPEIYYGERPNDYVVVNTKVQEFGYPTTEGNVYTTYDGTGGVKLSSLFKRLVYGVYFGNFKLVLSTDITNDSRILYQRDIMDRVDAIAPFLLYDQDPYMIVSDDGRLYWMIDAYSVTDRFPYSRPVRSGVNYIRNPVKVVVDAYNGDVSFYLVDEDDVLIQTYATIFPTLFKPLAEMPESLRRHIRYPRTLLRVQAEVFSTYHMTNPNNFYNKEDLWEIPVYRDRTMDPYYIVMKLPEGEKEEFVLLLPFTPSKRDNLAAWMAARSDGDDYGKVVVYTFPRDRLVFGPRQIDARIDQDAYISQQLTLWGQSGSDVIRGSLLIIPIENSLIYVQPLYLVATDRVGLPELRRVIVAFGKEVVMEDTLEAAVQRLFKGRVPAGVKRAVEAAEEELSDREFGMKALESLKKAREALRSDDWGGFGRLLERTEELLKRIK
ncbi:MAG: UPF0182 family protein [Deltaproteobacteria bacterium]|nr:UPF0182 family protein [Deltaproteobacteria bacterium]